MLGKTILKIVLDEARLRHGVNEMAEAISETYGRDPITIVAIMTGSLVLLADLIRRLEMPLRVGLIQASSYRGGMTSGELSIQDNWMLDIEGRDVLLVDDIFDTGKTLVDVVTHMKKSRPKSIRTAVLLRKKGTQTVEFEPDFVAFSIPDEFVVGYGLDYEDQYRNLPYVAALESADLEAHRTI